MFLFKSNSEKDTFNFGKNIGNLLKKNDLVCLDGELGTGKTVITKGIAEVLEIDDYITSPTFTLINEYTGKYNLYHFDVYRIEGADDLYDIGFLDYIDDGICVIEWSENVKDALPKEYIKILIEKDENDENDYNLRNIYIEFIGEKYKDVKKIFAESGNCEDEIVGN